MSKNTTTKPSARETALTELNARMDEHQATAAEKEQAVKVFDEASSGRRPGYTKAIEKAVNEVIGNRTPVAAAASAKEEAKATREGKFNTDHYTRMAKDPEYRAEVLETAKQNLADKAAEKAEERKTAAAKPATERKPREAGARATREGGKWDSRKNRETGTTVTVYDAVTAQMDTTDGKWATVCDDHGSVLNSKTYVAAKSAMTKPSDWCEGCKAHASSAA